MARKGSRKVRTGCLTCKIRKIKCDEGKPFCNRCTSTGRKCDGYSAEPATVLRWQRPQTLQYEGSSSSDEEARALQYYCERVAPVLAGPTNPYFWTHLVVQFSNFEPAVKHSVIAIGLLFGDLEAGIDPHLDEVALRHYNAAIFELKPVQNKGLVLLVCLLFVCIELLQSNRDGAVRHCNHGLAILEISCSQPWIREHLLPIFRRLSLLPAMYGSPGHEFPDLAILRCPLPTAFADYGHAQAAVDDLSNQTALLVHHGEEYRVGALRREVPTPELLELQAAVSSSLSRWYALFEDLDARCKYAPDTRIRGAPRTYMLMRYEICRVWADTAFSADETAYDAHVDSLRRIIERASKLAESLGGAAPPSFTFEGGFVPMLFFIATKCRALDVRLEALRLMSVIGSPREVMMDRGELHAIGRRVVELEHGIGLDAWGQLQLTGPESCMGLPPDQMRVRQYVPDQGIPWLCSGFQGTGPRAGFLMRTPEDAIYLHEEAMADIHPQYLLDATYESYSSSPSSSMDV
ncbi:C6 zinc finger domain protein [Colletotrichum plurivorum]|uniref:C6 zinc finger domain protein n=1 Tax=Colletotrichum plurivorum TaxID=2175906 RepID=A0A8H6N967_9PEZI|nr:C6 zinc finger domain protein [Colletotrichum plurivorum]